MKLLKKSKFKHLMLGISSAAILGVTLAGCSGSGGSGTTDNSTTAAQASADTSSQNSDTGKEGKTLTVAITEDVGTLNPHSYGSPMCVQSLIYEGMTRYMNDEVVGGIAESWDISDDGKEYIFHLDKDNVFSDGTPVNAEIVKKNFDAVLKYREEHNWMEMFNVLDKVEIVDDYTVKFVLTAPYDGLLQELSLARPERIGAEAMFPADGDTKEKIAEPIGSGPWKLSDRVEGQYAVFERNEKYHGTVPDFQYLKLIVIPDMNTAANSLKAGEVDMIYDLAGHGTEMTGDTFNELMGSGFAAELSDPVSTNTIALNSANGPTKELEVRQAIAHAVDKESIAQNIYSGMVGTADYLMSKDTTYCDFDDLTVYEHDEEKAKDILDKAGWTMEGDYRKKNGEELKVSFLYEGSNDAMKNLGQALQANLKKVGVNVELVPEDSTVFYESQEKGLFNLIQSETWGMPFDPYSYFSSFRHPSHADYAAQSGISEKAEVDKSVSEMLNATDPKIAEEKSHYVLKTLSDESVYVPLVYTQVPYVYNADVVSNVSFNTTVDVPFEEFKAK